MTIAVVPKNVSVVSPPRHLVASGAEFGIHLALNGESYEFTFSWNRDYQYYAMHIMSQSRNTLLKVYPQTGEVYDIRFFNPKDTSSPHAKVMIQDATGGMLNLSPINFGTTHSIAIIPYGEVTL